MTTSTTKLMKAPDGSMIQVPIKQTIIHGTQTVDNGIQIIYRIIDSTLTHQVCYKVITNERIDKVLNNLDAVTVANYNQAASHDESMDPIRVYVAKLLFDRFIENFSMELFYYERIKDRAIKDIVTAVSVSGFPDESHRERIEHLSEHYQKSTA